MPQRSPDPVHILISDFLRHEHARIGQDRGPDPHPQDPMLQHERMHNIDDASSLQLASATSGLVRGASAGALVNQPPGPPETLYAPPIHFWDRQVTFISTNFGITVAGLGFWHGKVHIDSHQLVITASKQDRDAMVKQGNVPVVHQFSRIRASGGKEVVAKIGTRFGMHDRFAVDVISKPAKPLMADSARAARLFGLPLTGVFAVQQIGRQISRYASDHNRLIRYVDPRAEFYSVGGFTADSTYHARSVAYDSDVLVAFRTAPVAIDKWPSLMAQVIDARSRVKNNQPADPFVLQGPWPLE